MAAACRRLSKAAALGTTAMCRNIAPRLSAWTMSVTRSLRAGAALWFDYGLPRSQFTYRSVTREPCCAISGSARTANPLLYPGLQDITAWVDYTCSPKLPARPVFALSGFTRKSHFLAGLKWTRNADHGRRR